MRLDQILMVFGIRGFKYVFSLSSFDAEEMFGFWPKAEKEAGKRISCRSDWNVEYLFFPIFSFASFPSMG